MTPIERIQNPMIEISESERFHTLPLPSPSSRWRFLPTEEVSSSSEYRDNMTSEEYYAHVNDLVRGVITSDGYRDPDTGYISDTVWKTLVDGGILAASFGDRDPATRQEEIMTVARMLSYYDLSLGLTFGITTALAIMPLQRFGSDEQQKKYLTKIKNGEMMGLAITERDKSGSATLDMDSAYVVNEDWTVDLNLKKHLQGLSGKAGLVVAAVRTNAKTKTVGLFIVDQENIDTELTNMEGLSGIPYGTNTGNIKLNLQDHFMIEIPRDELSDNFQDIFTKSRILFIGMTLGHQERMEEEANSYAAKRKIGRVFQADMPVPRRRRLQKIQSRGDILESMANQVATYTTEGKSLLEGDTTNLVTEANIVKTLSAAYAYESAEDRAILRGGDAFYGKKALQDLMDIWPFQIFEGTVDMLNTQIGHAIFRNEISSDIWGTIENLDKRSYKALTDIASIKRPTPVHEEIFGRIVSRIFALGCIDKNNLTPEDFKRAKKMLNVEIRQLAEEFFSIDEDD